MYVDYAQGNAAANPICVRMYEMVRDAPLSFRVEAELKAALERAAKADDRSVSSLVERVLKGWLTERGYLTKAGE